MKTDKQGNDVLNEVEEMLSNLESVKNTVFGFWFSDREHLRSPFPDHMREKLKEQAYKTFLEWTGKLNDITKKEVSQEILLEKFEEIIFEKALKLAKSEDEKITIRYPNLPRLGDRAQVKDLPEKEGESVLVSRRIVKEGDSSFLEVEFKSKKNGETWTTRFELPE